MHSRIEYLEVAPDAMKTMFGLEKYLAQCGHELIVQFGARRVVV